MEKKTNNNPKIFIKKHNKPNKFESINFNKCPKVVADIDVVECELVNELKILKAKRPIILAGSNVNRLGFVDKIKSVCEDGGIQINGIIADIAPESPIDNIYQAYRVFKNSYCDSIIAIGGGSVIDTAKVIKAMNSINESRVEKLFGYNGIRDGVAVPLIVIQTTIGVSNDTTNVAVILDKDNNSKVELVSNNFLPNVSMVDPIFTKTLPPSMIVNGSFDALTHIIEGITGKQTSILQKHIGYRALKDIGQNLEKTIDNPENMQIRLKLMLSGSMAGIVMENAMVGSVHALAHAIGAVLNVPHSFAVAKSLKFVMRNNLPAINGDYSMILFYLAGKTVWKEAEGNKDEACIDYIDKWYTSLESKIGQTKRLVDYGLDESVFEAILEKFMGDGAMLSNVKTTTTRDVLDILAQMVKEGV